jgi:hypothetical protein
VFNWNRRFSDRKDSLEDNLLEGRQYFQDGSTVKMKLPLQGFKNILLTKHLHSALR